MDIQSCPTSQVPAGEKLYVLQNDFLPKNIKELCQTLETCSGCSPSSFCRLDSFYRLVFLIRECVNTEVMAMFVNQIQFNNQ